jgi:hypothetical protein
MIAGVLSLFFFMMNKNNDRGRFVRHTYSPQSIVIREWPMNIFSMGLSILKMECDED